MTKIENIYDAVDDFGLISSAEAAELGMSNAELVQQAARNKLVRVARGVYRMPVWPSQPQAPYAIAVKAAGKDAFLYGESVIALLSLAPTNPAVMYIASPKRIRRDLGSGARIFRVSGVQPVLVDGIRCQPVPAALISAAKTMGSSRALDATREALAQGIITADEMEKIEQELRRGEKTQQYASFGRCDQEDSE